MKDLSSQLISSFSQFLSEISTQKKENLHGSIISFIKEFENYNFETKLDSLLKSSENSFYFSSSKNNFSFIALDQVYNITENGQARFILTDKKVKDISGKVISNKDERNLPLFVGGMKFTVEHPDDEWKDFSDSNWFIPEIFIFRKNEKECLIYNCFVEQSLSVSRLTEKFSKKIESMLQIKENKVNGKPRITNSTGLSPKDKKKWKQIISLALEKILEQELKKVVLARKIDLVLSGEINLTSALNSFKNDYSDCCLFAFHKGSSTFFGATPELLAKISENKIEVDAVAGSINRSSGEEDKKLESNLLNNEKDLNEHQYVVDYLLNAIKSLANNLKFDEKPSIKKLKNIQHLSTKISGELRNNFSLMNILKELHPTPAVCGFPKDAALNLIKKIENQKRGMYSGIVGWFNLNNQGEFAVSIRSAVTRGNKLTAYAGSGIVEGSDPDSEYEETEIKFKPILSLFNEKKD